MTRKAKKIEDKEFEKQLTGVQFAEAPSYGKPAMYYDKTSAGSKAYLSLAAEVIDKSK